MYDILNLIQYILQFNTVGNTIRLSVIIIRTVQHIPISGWEIHELNRFVWLLVHQAGTKETLVLVSGKLAVVKQGCQIQTRQFLKIWEWSWVFYNVSQSTFQNINFPQRNYFLWPGGKLYFLELSRPHLDTGNPG